MFVCSQKYECFMCMCIRLYVHTVQQIYIHVQDLCVQAVGCTGTRRSKEILLRSREEIMFNTDHPWSFIMTVINSFQLQCNLLPSTFVACEYYYIYDRKLIQTLSFPFWSFTGVCVLYWVTLFPNSIFTLIIIFIYVLMFISMVYIIRYSSDRPKVKVLKKKNGFRDFVYPLLSLQKKITIAVNVNETSEV